MIACLLIHGYTGGPYEVEPLADYLDKHTDWHIEVPTLAGHGTELHLENTTYKDWLNSAEESYKKLASSYDDIYVVGFSMGGMIAAYLAAKYDVKKLVLLAAAAKYLDFKQIHKDLHGFIKERFKGDLQNNKLFKHYKNKLPHVPVKSSLEFMKLVNFTRPLLREIKIPVLIVQGLQDGLVSYKTAYYFDEEIKSDHKELVLLDRSKHLLCLGEDKDTVNKMVYEFLTKSGNEHFHSRIS